MSMLAREVYQSAMTFLDESTLAGACEDYEERAPYILAVFCNNALSIDEVMRSFTGQETEIEFDGIYVALEDDFPLLPRFASIASLYLAAMLVLDDNEELSDKLYSKYEQDMKALYDGMTGIGHGITDKYFVN